MSAELYDFTPERIEELKQLYPTTKNDMLALHFNCSYSKIINLQVQYGLKKDIEWVRETARQNMNRPDHPAKKFWKQKGCISFNKGKKQTEYMTPEGIARTTETRFKKGQQVWNHKPVGYERVNKYGYVEIKVAEPNVFKFKHRLTWEKQNGSIPKGYNVQFKDDDRSNCDDINNLYLISRSDQLKTENSMFAKYPKDVQLAIHAKGALNRQINKLLKQE